MASRQGAEALPAVDGVVIQGGYGPTEFDVRYDESQDDGAGTSSRSGGFSVHRPRFDDAARFELTERVWTRAPTTQGTVADLDGDEPAVLARSGAATQWNDGAWRVLDPPGEEDGQSTDHGVLVLGRREAAPPIQQAEQHPGGPRPLQSDGAWLDLDP